MHPLFGKDSIIQDRFIQYEASIRKNNLIKDRVIPNAIPLFINVLIWN